MIEKGLFPHSFHRRLNIAHILRGCFLRGKTPLTAEIMKFLGGYSLKNDVNGRNN